MHKFFLSLRRKVVKVSEKSPTNQRLWESLRRLNSPSKTAGDSLRSSISASKTAGDSCKVSGDSFGDSGKVSGDSFRDVESPEKGSQSLRLTTFLSELVHLCCEVLVALHRGFLKLVYHHVHIAWKNIYFGTSTFLRFQTPSKVFLACCMDDSGLCHVSYGCITSSELGDRAIFRPSQNIYFGISYSL